MKPLDADFEAWKALVESQKNEDKNEEAEFSYKQAILGYQLHQAFCFNGLGEVQFEQEKYADSEASHKQATELDPRNAEYWDNLGDAQYYQEKYKEAELSYAEAVLLDVSKADYWEDLADAQYKQDKFNEAIVSYKEATVLDKENANYWCALGYAYFYQKIYDEGELAFKQATFNDPKVADYWNMLGNTQFAQNKYDEALSSYEKVILCNNEKAVYWGNLALTQINLGKENEAVISLQNLLLLDPFDENALNTLLNLFNKLNRLHEAAKTIIKFNIEYNIQKVSDNKIVNNFRHHSIKEFQDLPQAWDLLLSSTKHYQHSDQDDNQFNIVIANYCYDKIIELHQDKCDPEELKIIRLKLDAPSMNVGSPEYGIEARKWVYIIAAEHGFETAMKIYGKTLWNNIKRETEPAIKKDNIPTLALFAFKSVIDNEIPLSEKAVPVAKNFVPEMINNGISFKKK